MQVIELGYIPKSVWGLEVRDVRSLRWQPVPVAACPTIKSKVVCVDCGR